ncbi:hypothetical protein LCGC14_1390090 [marine sediment metagenome]|uniref:Zona occludens toxin N-terminal domain-containing protein n=1 Tax=marine sediment metagenome TaxID=412755 RepID=A0A0F9KL10_9ZZZZ
MRVQPFNYPLDDRLLIKIDLMIDRCVQENPKRDAVLLFEGAEGEGKTTFSIAVGYYIKWKTGREFNHKNLFFDLKELIKFAQENEEKIIIWDEPALQALSRDVLTKIVKDLDRLLMMARKKRHFIIINMAYFNKFNEYIVWQRPLGMIHVYSRKEVQAGRYVYIKKKALERLWHSWRRQRKRDYRKYCSKSIRGTFPDVLNPNYKNNVLSDFNLKDYEKKKDEAIMLIGSIKDKKDVHAKKNWQLAQAIDWLIKEGGLKQKEVLEKLKESKQNLYNWRKLPPPEENPLENWPRQR